VVDLGESEVLVGVILEVFDGLLWGKSVLIDLFQDVLKIVFHPLILSQGCETVYSITLSGSISYLLV